MLRQFSGWICYVVARILVRAHQPNAALVLFRMAAREDPRNEEAQHELASVLWWFGYQEEAVEQYRLLTVANPHRATFHYELGHVLKDLRRYSEAVEVFENTLTLEPRAEIYVELARCSVWVWFLMKLIWWWREGQQRLWPYPLKWMLTLLFT